MPVKPWVHCPWKEVTDFVGEVPRHDELVGGDTIVANFLLDEGGIEAREVSISVDEADSSSSTAPNEKTNCLACSNIGIEGFFIPIGWGCFAEGVLHLVFCVRSSFQRIIPVNILNVLEKRNSLLIKTATDHWSANFETVTVVTQYVQTARARDKSLFNPNNRIAPWYRSIIFRFITNGITNALPISKSTTISGTRRMARCRGRSLVQHE
jgi:hypothetical protein